MTLREGVSISQVGEYGQRIRANIGVDVSNNIGLRMILEPTKGVKVVLTHDDGVSVGRLDVMECGKLLQANQYLEYVVKEDDLDTSGRWGKKGVAEISDTEVKVGLNERFIVRA